MAMGLPDSEKLASSGTKRDISAGEVMHRRFREHGIVFQLRFAEWWTVASNENEFG